MRAVTRRWLQALLHIKDSPQRTAAAYALGVLFGFSPLLGLHTVLALACAFALGLNRVAVLLGVYSNLPWIIAPYYALATIAGSYLVGTKVPPGFRERIEALFLESLWHRSFWDQLFVLLRPMLAAFLVGSTIGAVLLALVAYRLSLAVLTRKRPAEV